MSSGAFKVQRLDHVHVQVRDRALAVGWYRSILGLELYYDYTAHGDPRGPIVLSSDSGETHLALFEADEPYVPPDAHRTVAFRVDAEAFLRFLDHLDEVELRGPTGARVSRADVRDHGNVYSVYFRDPDGNPYEITTYEYAKLRSRLAAQSGSGTAAMSMRS